LDITVIGCGRWGSFIGWYLDRIGHQVTLYGRSSSPHMKQLLQTRSNGYLSYPDTVRLTSDLTEAVSSQVLVISVASQGLREMLAQPLFASLENKIIVLCMKGLEKGTGKRLSQIVSECVSPSNQVAVWIGPGHVQEFAAGVPNCMVIDSQEEKTKKFLVDAFSSDLIRFYYGEDLIGNEVGAAAKNVIGIAAGMLDGLKLTTLKGALMSRGTREIARLIKAMGGNENSAYGLCHLGDYEATVFSQYSHNRRYGECLVTGESYGYLAEGKDTVAALIHLETQYQVELPICRQVYRVIYEGLPAKEGIDQLFSRSIKREFYE
jgi:glycerol-3-phosphate dehydrogenase (NAD(P)+)